jgi:hypothetical protein
LRLLAAAFVCRNRLSLSALWMRAEPMRSYFVLPNVAKLKVEWARSHQCASIYTCLHFHNIAQCRL